MQAQAGHKTPVLKASVLKDAQDLARLLGIDSIDLSEVSMEPRWRRVEVLRELQTLESQIYEDWRLE